MEDSPSDEPMEASGMRYARYARPPMKMTYSPSSNHLSEDEIIPPRAFDDTSTAYHWGETIDDTAIMATAMNPTI